jgi:hypothetical protein
MLRNGDLGEGAYIFPDVSWGVLIPPMSEGLHSPLPRWMIMSGTKVVKYIDSLLHVVPCGMYTLWSWSVTSPRYESQGMGRHKRAHLEFTMVDNVTPVVFQSWNHHRMTYQASLCGPIINYVSLVPAAYTYQHHKPESVVAGYVCSLLGSVYSIQNVFQRTVLE